jgi:hypothetical protein
MNSHFLNGFAAELTKEAGHPLFSDTRDTRTLLGKKVRGMVSRSMSKGKVKNYRMKKKAGLTDGYSIGKGVGARVTGPKEGKKITGSGEVNLGGRARSSKGATKARPKSLMGSVTGGLSFGDMPSLPGQKKKTPSSQVTMGKATRLSGSGMHASSRKALGGTKYGPGKGLDSFKGQRAQPFTENDDKGKIGNPTENPENFNKRK